MEVSVPYDPLEIEGTSIRQPNCRALATGLNDPSAGQFSRAMSGNIPVAGSTGDREFFPNFSGKNASRPFCGWRVRTSQLESSLTETGAVYNSRAGRGDGTK